MKTRITKLIMALAVILPVAFTSCTDDYINAIEGTGEVIESELVLDDFSGIISAIAAQIYLTQGDEQEVWIEAQENIIDNIELDVRNDVWVIEYKEFVRWAKPVKIYITVPDLKKVSITGSGSVTGLTEFTGLEHLDLTISGSGHFDMETESESLDVLISGAGGFDLSGQTEKFSILVSGSGSINAEDLLTQEADVTISGSGNVYLDVRDYLNVLISGSGSVYYSGNPEIESHISGSGTLRRNR